MVEMKRIVLAAIALVFVLGVLRWQNGLKKPLRTSPGTNTEAQAPSASPTSSNFLRLRQRAQQYENRPLWPTSPFDGQGKTLLDATVDERMEFNKDLRMKSAETLFDLWVVTAQGHQDSLKLDFIANALAVRLRADEGDAAQVVSRIVDFVRDGSQNEFARWHLVETLGEAATPRALQALVDLLHFEDTPRDLESILLRQIARVGDIRWGGRFQEELAPLLEQEWSRAQAREPLLSVLSLALAKIGAPKSVELLLNEVLRGSRTIPEFEQRNDPRAWAAFDALEKIRNVRAIPVLERCLRQSSVGSMELVTSGRALAFMGQPGATSVLIQWAQGFPQDGSSLIDDWLSRMRDQTSVDLLGAASATGSFVNAANRVALQKTLATWKAHRSLPSE